LHAGGKNRLAKGKSRTLQRNLSLSCIALGLPEDDPRKEKAKKKKKVVSKDDSSGVTKKHTDDYMSDLFRTNIPTHKKKIHERTLEESGDLSSSGEMDEQKVKVEEEPEIVNDKMDEDEKKMAKKRLFGSKIDCPYGFGFTGKDKRANKRKEAAKKVGAKIASMSLDSSSQSLSLSDSFDDYRSQSPAPGGKSKDSTPRSQRKTSLIYPPVPEHLRYWDADDMFNVHINEFSREDKILSVYSGQVEVNSLDASPSPKTPEELLKQKKVAFQPCAFAFSLFMIIGITYRGRRLFLKRHLWDLKEVSTVPESNSILFLFKDNRSCLIFVPSPQIIVDGLLHSLKKIQDKAYFPKIDAPLQNRLRKAVSQINSEESEDVELDTKTLFQSFCVHDSVPFNEEAQNLLIDYAKRKDRHLDLTCICRQQDCALCEMKEKKEGTANALTPAEYALRFLEHDRHFIRVSCSGNTSVGATKALSNAICNHSRLKAVTLIDCDDDDKCVMDFMSSLCEAKGFLCLDRLCLKSVNLGEKGFKQLGTAIFGANSAWKELILDDCGGTPKAVAALLDEMSSKTICFKELEVLSLARNKLEDVGTESLNSFFDELNRLCGIVDSKPPPLKRLDLSESKFVPPLLDKISLLANLEELDLSGCLFGNKGVETFSSVLKHLKKLHAKDMQMGSDDTMQNILSAFGKNSKNGDCLMLDFGLTADDSSSLSDKRKLKRALSALDMLVSETEGGTKPGRSGSFSKLPFNIFPTVVLESDVGKRIVSLELVGVIMNSACVKALGTQYETKRVLQRICIRNLPTSCITDPKEWGDAICSLVDGIKSLRSAEFSYSFTTEILEPVLEFLSRKRKRQLVSLNIAGNHMGKEGVKLIDNLITSSPVYLHELYIQDNDFDMDDLKTLRKSLPGNKNITHFYYKSTLPFLSDLSPKEAKEVKSRMMEYKEFDEYLKPTLKWNFEAFEKKQFDGFFPDKIDLPDLQMHLRIAQFDKFVSLLPPCECSLQNPETE